MRILYNNIIPDNLTISATSEDSNYPVENIYDKVLLKRFQSTTCTTTITLTWWTEQSANCIFFGYIAADSVVVTLKNVSGSTIYTNTYTYQNFNEAYYFDTTYTTIRTVTIAFVCKKNNMVWADGNNAVWADGNNMVFYGDYPMMVGGIGLGVYLEAPGNEPTVSFPYQYKNKRYKTEGGQLSGTKITTLRACEVTWPIASQSERLALLAFLEEVSTSDTIWVDLYHENHNDFQPMYCNVEDISDFKKLGTDGFLTSVTATFQECK